MSAFWSGGLDYRQAGPTGQRRKILAVGLVLQCLISDALLGVLRLGLIPPPKSDDLARASRRGATEANAGGVGSLSGGLPYEQRRNGDFT